MQRMKGTFMRRAVFALTATAAVAAATPASAATIVIFTDPMSLNRQTLVLDTPGPDRVLVCTPPPGSTCTQVPFRRARRAG